MQNRLRELARDRNGQLYWKHTDKYGNPTFIHETILERTVTPAEIKAIGDYPGLDTEEYDPDFFYILPFKTYSLLPLIFERDPYLLEQFFCPTQRRHASGGPDEMEYEEADMLEESDCVLELKRKAHKCLHDNPAKRWNQAIEYFVTLNCFTFRYDRLRSLSSLIQDFLKEQSVVVDE